MSEWQSIVERAEDAAYDAAYKAADAVYRSADPLRGLGGDAHNAAKTAARAAADKVCAGICQSVRDAVDYGRVTGAADAAAVNKVGYEDRA